MTDALGNEVEEGNLIYITHNNQIGIVQGGVTPGGKLRFLGTSGSKQSADSWNFVVITKEQALLTLNEKVNDAAEENEEELNQACEEMNEAEIRDGWYFKRNQKIIDIVTKILEE